MADRNFLLEGIKVARFLIFVHWSHESNLSRKVKGKCFRPVGSCIPINGRHALHNLVRPIRGNRFPMPMSP